MMVDFPMSQEEFSLRVVNNNAEGDKKQIIKTLFDQVTKGKLCIIIVV